MLGVNLCGLQLKNPVIAASGTFGFGRDYQAFYDVSQLGGISCKGLTYEAKAGNSGLRLYETPSGLMNSIGLENPSVAGFIAQELDFMLGLDTVTIANIGGNNIDQYIKAVQLIDQTPVPVIELNISCPNVKEGGMAFGLQCASAKEVVRQVRQATDKILMVKLSPNAENIKAMASACVEAGADCLSLVNTFNALAVDIYQRKPVFKHVTAGLSGPAIKPIALRMVKEVYDTVDVPIVGLGGIMTWQDAIEFIMAGSRAIQVGTANFLDPLACPKIIQGIQGFMEEEGIKDLSEIVGIL